MKRDREGRGVSSMLEELVSNDGGFKRKDKEREKDKKERRVGAALSKKSSKRDRSREKSKQQKKPKRRSSERSEENKKSPRKPAMMAHRKRIRWLHDDKMFKMKYFRVNDEPIADGVSETQIRDIRDRLLKESATQSNLQVQAKNVGKR